MHKCEICGSDLKGLGPLVNRNCTKCRIKQACLYCIKVHESEHRGSFIKKVIVTDTGEVWRIPKPIAKSAVKVTKKQGTKK